MMFTRLLDNWPYKIFSVIIAIGLYFYVSGQLNPQMTKDYPVTVIHVPEGLSKKDATPTVTLQLSGSAGALDGLRATDISATVDASVAHAGVNRNLPVTVNVVPEYRDRIAIVGEQPSVAVVTLDKLESERRPVHVIFTHAAATGYAYGTPLASPATVKLVAPQSVLDAIKDVVVDLDERLDEGHWADTSPIDRVVEIEARDGDGRRIAGVTAMPAEARVTVSIVRVASVKTVPISPAIIGRPASSAAVSGAVVDPSFAILSGPADILAKTNVVMTSPIDVTGAGSDLRRTATLEAPQGLTATTSRKVTVTVQIVPVSQTPPPPPAPVSATPTPLPRPTAKSGGAQH
ncbi:MAG: CdaR family protein [Capsulimonadaceae bacterium]|nr:CdaR family protein [Capsulimonadaceae bacterium]